MTKSDERGCAVWLVVFGVCLLLWLTVGIVTAGIVFAVFLILIGIGAIIAKEARQ